MRQQRSKTSLFLMELLAVILVFSLASAVCLRVFAAARQKSQDGSDLNGAVAVAQSCAEAWKAAAGNPEEAARLAQLTYADNEISKFYDSAWQSEVPGDALATQSASQAPSYVLCMTWQGSTAQITVSKIDGTEIFALEAYSLGVQ